MKNIHDLSFFIVDDDFIYNSLIKNYLETKNFKNLKSFYDGPSCLEYLSHLPDIVILDFEMGDVSGLDVLKKIREFDSNTNVIFLSGQKDVDVAVDSFKCGSIDYIVKDDDALINLSKVIEEVFRLKQRIKKKNIWFDFFKRLGI